MPHLPDTRQWHNIVFLSAISMFVPTIIAIFRQPVVFTVILINAALWSSLYHYSAETKYQSLDEIWANMVIIVAGTLMVLTLPMYPFYHWRIVLPTITGLAALYVFFFTKAYVPLGQVPQNLDEYDKWHSLWHILATVTILILVTSKFNLKVIGDSYYKIWMMTWKKATK